MLKTRDLVMYELRDYALPQATPSKTKDLACFVPVHETAVFPRR